ncbi:MAG: hypothetical protein ACD_37C00674G0003 [uncultured bacterium]|nr:MAG: hypothetical protein ACD_37C00674G0003 [uncultured bacterium]OGH14746.1 MAG: hypothetical protein A2687_02745 [Candidatus Levybacteria bacterium RIFCSPHIGHO2_01_FULL_38_26]
MRERQPREKYSGTLASSFRAIGAAAVLNAGIACGNLGGAVSIPSSVRETSVSSEEQTRLLENGLHLNGDGFISIRDITLPDDVSVELLLTPDSLSRAKNVAVVTLVDNNGNILGIESRYRLLDTDYFNLYMRVMQDLDDSINYSYFAKFVDRKNSSSNNSCPVKSGYSMGKKVSMQEFKSAKEIKLEIRDGDLIVSENGKNTNMRIRPEEYVVRSLPDDNNYLVDEYKIPVVEPCSPGSGKISIGGAMRNDGRLSEPFNGEVYGGKISDLTNGDGQNSRALVEFEATHGLLVDLTKNGNIALVGNISDK